MKFPKILHVTKQEPDNDEPYLLTHLGGVFDVDEAQPMAIYRLISVGRVQIDKKFVGKIKPR